MTHYVKKIVKILLGILLLVIGGTFGFIPFIPGWVFGILGFYLLATEIPWVRRHYDQFKNWIRSRVGHDPEEYVFNKMNEFKGAFNGNGVEIHCDCGCKTGECDCSEVVYGDEPLPNPETEDAAHEKGENESSPLAETQRKDTSLIS